MSSRIVSLQDFLSTTPVQLTSPLIGLGPCISFCAGFAKTLSWSTSSWYDSWLLLLSWSALCLFSESLVRFSLPLTVLALLYLSQQFNFVHSNQKQLAHEQTLETVITDLNTLQSLLPTISSCSPPFDSPKFLLKLAAVLTPFSIVLVNFIIPPRVLLCLSGAVLITWRAPWAMVIRHRLWGSAWLRWGCYRAWSWLTSLPLPYADLLQSGANALSSSSQVKSESKIQLRFLFTVYENQRWWMGLDFTAALLPNERPSWSSISLHPVQPPTTFSLPEPTSIETTTPLIDGNSRKIRRTAVWRWEDPEWRALVRMDGNPLSRVEKPLPTQEDGSTKTALLAKAAHLIQKEKDGAVHQPPHDAADAEKESAPREEDPPPQEDTITDTDGWVYGDNKWEATSSKGGMGKYTRYRRWTRIAVVEEQIEELSDDDDMPPSPRTPTRGRPPSIEIPRTDSPSETGSPRDALRNRLKNLAT